MRSFTSKWMYGWLTSLPVILALLLVAVPSRTVAQDQDDQDDPPARAARLSYTSGSVSFAPAGTDEWVGAVVNRPMTTGDKLWTDQGSRAELRVDAYAIRLGEMTGFSFLNLDDRTVQIRLTEGSVNVHVRRLDQDQVLEVDTPNLAFNVLRPGSYRINVNENGDATIINVRDGQGEVTGGGSAYPIHAGQSATFEGTEDQLSADVEGYPGDDDFDRWCYDRDSRWERSQSARYVSDDVVGYEDLDEYGGWRSVPEYGTVWFPHTTVVGWQPYRYGHWVWISPWGWTWVDDAPWGFAPFHYGRWVAVGGVWGWVPVAPRPAVVTVAYVRPVYAPALVAWVGGPNFSVSVGVGGGVAWFPLGPRDVYCPSYRVGPRYVERVNVYNTTIINRTQVTNVYNTVYVQKNVTNINYQNRTYVTATSRESFTSAQPVGRNMVRVDSRQVASAQVSPMTPAVAPQQRSVFGTGAAARVRPPERVMARPVVAKTAPPPPVAPVNQQLQKVQANGGRPVATSQIRENNVPRNNVRVAQQARPAQLPPQGQRMNARPAQPNQAQPNANRPAQQNQPQAQPNANRPAQPPTQAQPPNNRPPQQNQPQAQPNNRPAQPQAQPENRPNNRPYNDRPPTSRPNVNPQMQERQEQQMDNLRKQQDQQRQKLEQKQQQENQKMEQQRANEQRQQQQQQRQQQQLEQMERKHDQQQQKMEQRQQQEAQKQQRQQQQRQQQQSKPPKQEKPPKQDKDRPPH